MLDLNQVRMFVQVARAHSFAQAARQLGVPPNTLSRQVRQLEAQLDTRLLQRTTRKLTLTGAGSAFYERCAPAVDKVLEAGKEIAGGAQTPSGTVRVAAPADFLDFFHIEWVIQFLAAYPKVKLDFVLNDSHADLIGEAIDVAFRGGAARDPRHVYRQIGSQHFKLVASPGYLKSRGVPENLHALAAHDCLTSSARQGQTTWLLTGPDGTEEVRVTGRFSANSARSLLKSCVSGLGIALLPNMLIIADLDAGRLTHVLPNYRSEGGAVAVLLPSREQVPPAVSAFIEFATARLETLIGNQARASLELSWPSGFQISST
jgi:DNA-binding transcriptional LysR family regulator